MTDERLGPPPVEPMSDVSWARIERGLWTRLDESADGSADESAAAPAPRRWLPRRRAWLVPALAAAVVLVLMLGGRDTRRALPSRTAVPAVGVEPSRVVAGAAPSSVSFGDAHIELAAESAIVLSREQSAPSVLLEQGTATFTVAPRIDRSPFIVRAGDTVVRVVGTQFSVGRRDDRVTVEVSHGVVEIQHRGRLQRVSAGQLWRSVQPDRVDTPAAVRPPAPRSPDTDAMSAPDEDSQPPSPTAPERAGRTQPSQAPDTARVTYERLAALEVRHPERALAGYLELSRGGSDWAAVALYAAGRLAADRGDPRAPSLLTTYLRRFPSGANADDARTLLERIDRSHRGHGDHDDHGDP